MKIIQVFNKHIEYLNVVIVNLYSLNEGYTLNIKKESILRQTFLLLFFEIFPVKYKEKKARKNIGA